MFSARLFHSARDKIVVHLRALGASDRRLRFGGAMSDQAIVAYARRIDFERDAVFGVYGGDLDLVGVCHVAPSADIAEFGVSVNASHRRQGIGSALVSRAALHARNAGIRALFMHCLKQNEAIMRIARRLGMRIVIEGGEAEGHLELRPGDATSFAEEMIQEGLSIYDYASKGRYLCGNGLLPPLARPMSGRGLDVPVAAAAHSECRSGRV